MAVVGRLAAGTVMLHMWEAVAGTDLGRAVAHDLM